MKNILLGFCSFVLGLGFVFSGGMSHAQEKEGHSKEKGENAEAHVPYKADFGGCSCGEKGTPEERMADCERVSRLASEYRKKTRNGTEWALVTRANSGAQVWRDGKTGMLWNTEAFAWEWPGGVVSGSKFQQQGPVVGNPGHGLNKNWRSPTRAEIQSAQENGLFEVAGGRFWGWVGDSRKNKDLTATRDWLNPAGELIKDSNVGFGPVMKIAK